MELTPRLYCAAEKIKKCSFPADIGTDHAYIPIYLVKTGVCDKAIATDIRLGPIKRAEKNIKMYNLQDKIIVRQGAGLSPIRTGEVDCVILAGMGGYLISSILEDGKEKTNDIEYFVFQPMQAPEVVRKYLSENNFIIFDEQLVKEDGRIYEVFAAEHGSDSNDDEIYYEIGKRLIEKKDPLLEEFVENKMKNILEIIRKISKTESVNAQTRLIECKEKLKKYQEVLKCL